MGEVFYNDGGALYSLTAKGAEHRQGIAKVLWFFMGMLSEDLGIVSVGKTKNRMKLKHRHARHITILDPTLNRIIFREGIYFT